MAAKPAPSSLTPLEPALPERVPPAPPAATGESPPDLVGRIRMDVERRTGACASCLRVVRDQAMTWSDGSLGCPELGNTYPQRPVSGYWVVIRHDDRDYDYRVDDRGVFRLCAVERRNEPGTD